MDVLDRDGKRYLVAPRGYTQWVRNAIASGTVSLKKGRRRSDIAVEKEDRSLYVRALAPEVEDTLFVVGESGTTYEINLSASDNPDQTVIISYLPISLQVAAERTGKVPALDLLRSM